ncbi:MAG: hypothetical protein WDW38_008608 [Sanguina aurantia]
MQLHLSRLVTAQRAASSNGEAISQLHDELLKEIEDRRVSQSQLLVKLDRLAGADSKIPVKSAYPGRLASSPGQEAASASASASATQAAPQQTPTRPAPVPPTQAHTYSPAPVTHAQPAPERARGATNGASTATQEHSLQVTATAPPPLAGVNVMKVVMVGAECAPWSKTGGLGDVMAALPKALARRGHRVMVVVPRYGNYADAWETGVRRPLSVFNAIHEVGYFHTFIDGVDYVFVDHPCYHNREKNIYGGDRADLQFRCAMLSKAALEAVWHVPCGGSTYGDENCVFIANDWHTALLPIYLQAHYRDHGKMQFARCAFVIHNMAHQGRAAPFAESAKFELPEEYRTKMFLNDPVGGEHMNILKAGLQTAHRLVAVSTGYAWECQTQDGGWGLDAVLRENSWKLKGIVNGMDYAEWCPSTDTFLKSDGYQNYTLETLAEGKRACKMALQKQLGLPIDPDIPMLGFIGRLDHQKGVDLIRDSFEWLMNEGTQLVLLGSGSKELEDSLRAMEGQRRHQCRGWVGFSVSMAHRITAACDILLMPSRFEPCGLNQLYAMAYGTVPIVHAVGGLKDTVSPFNPYENSGTGWTFDRAEAYKLRETMATALYTYREQRESFLGIQRRGMAQDLSWDKAAQQYEDVLVEAKYQW